LRVRLAWIIVAVALAATPVAAQAGSFRTGFADPLFSSPEPVAREQWFGAATATHASIARIAVNWRLIAPTNTAGLDPENPASPQYDWTKLDAAVRSASANGIEVLFDVTSSPAWAEGANRPPSAAVGSWQPQAAAYGAFARAVATRYDGKFPDPLLPGSNLPAVHYFEAWNEPNLSKYLTPQYEGTNQVGATIYRQLLNSFYAGVKSVQPEATVVAGSLAPFGDEPGGERTRPVLFLRQLLCLSGGALTPLKCAQPARFDVLSDHPIAVGPPSQSAVSPLDVTTPDLGRLTTVLRKAEATKRALPAARKPLWVTEFWYDSNPPDPNGIPIFKQARWYEQALHSFWQQGAEVAISLQIRDSPKGKNYAFTNQSGVYFVDGTPKPSQTAMSFPFVAKRVGPFEVSVWGISPHRGKVRIQAQRKAGWVTLATVSASGPRHPFTTGVRLLRYANMRAVIGSTTSLPWTQG
jgi:hypothetical protein